jgi:phospholipase C
MHLQWGGGKMDGFVLSAATAVPATDGHASMAYYDQPDLPFYYWLANTFALGDRHFPSVLSGTWANRDYVVAAQSDGIKITGERMLSSTIPLIFDKLQAAAIPWGVYTDDALPLEYAVDFQRYPFGTVAQVLDNLKNGALPAVTFVDSLANVDDEHPPADLQRGEQCTRTLLDAAFKSPQWNDMAIFFTYDEAGGFADHVPPPAGCVATDNPAEQDFNQLGIRVPLIVVSPYAKRHHVSHLVHEHTSILRFIEMMFDIPALTRRDANSDALLDMFDFASPPNLDVGTLPAAGTGLCATTTQAKAPSKGVRTAR